jgi:hypothetical protein
MILVSSSGICCAASGDAIRKVSAAILTTFIIYKPLTISCDEATERVAGTPVWDLLLRAKHLFVAALLRVAPGATATACPAATLSKIQSVDQRMRGVGFRQLRTCRRTRPGQLWAQMRTFQRRYCSYAVQPRSSITFSSAGRITFSPRSASNCS